MADDEGAEATAADEHDDPDLTAAQFAESIRVLHSLRHAGLASLGSTLFDGPTSMGGHAAGRDLVINYGGPQRATEPPGPISQEHLLRIQETYVPPPDYPAAWHILSRERIVLLCGQPGTGRRTTALHLLDTLADRVYGVDPGAILAASVQGGLREDGGHLAELPPFDEHCELKFSRIAALSATLADLHAYLVFTVPPGIVTDPDVAERYAVPHRPPDYPDVVRSHIRVRPGDTTAAEALLSDNAVHAGLDCIRAPQAAVDIATRLVEMSKESDRPADLGPFFAALRRRRARQVLREERPGRPRHRVDLLCRRSLVLSLAVFAGLSYIDAATAAEVLCEKFIGTEFPRLIGREVFRTLRQHLIAELDAEIGVATVPGPWGQATSHHVQFIDPALPLALLEEIWEEHDTARLLLLDWLSELAVSSRVLQVRVRAAQVLGTLATRELYHVLQERVLEWSGSVNARVREAAVTVLEATAVTGGMYSQVNELLTEWCRDGNLNRQRTAILAMGTRITESDPEGTLDNLRYLTLRNSQALADSLRRSIVELFAGEHKQAVARALRSWAEDPDPRLRVAAIGCVPPLLHMIAASNDYADALTDLARVTAAALEDQAMKHQTWASLENWAAWTAEDLGRVDVAGQFLAEVEKASDAVAGQLRFYLALWAFRQQQTEGSARAQT